MTLSVGLLFAITAFASAWALSMIGWFVEEPPLSKVRILTLAFVASNLAMMFAERDPVPALLTVPLCLSLGIAHFRGYRRDLFGAPLWAWGAALAAVGLTQALSDRDVYWISWTLAGLGLAYAPIFFPPEKTRPREVKRSPKQSTFAGTPEMDPPDDATTDFAFAARRLLPRVFHHLHHDVWLSGRRGDGGSSQAWPHQRLGGDLCLDVVLQMTLTARPVTDRDLAAWGQTFDVVLQRAWENLARHQWTIVAEGRPDRLGYLATPLPFCFSSADDQGLFQSQWQDGYDVARAFRPPTNGAMPLSLCGQGPHAEPVFAFLSSRSLVYASSDHPDALAEMARRVECEVRAAEERSIDVGPLFISAHPWRWSEGRWQPLEMDRQHPAWPAWHRCRLHLERVFYARQKELLEGPARAGFENQAVMDSRVIDGPNGTAFSSTVWPPSGVALLPLTDEIAFMEVATRRFLGAMPRQELESCLPPGVLIPVEGLTPPRYRVEGWPVVERLPALRRAASVPGGAR